jgi:hypothetical protein
VCWVITVTCFSRLGFRTTSGIQESQGITQSFTTQSSWLELCPPSIKHAASEASYIYAIEWATRHGLNKFSFIVRPSIFATCFAVVFNRTSYTAGMACPTRFRKTNFNV